MASQTTGANAGSTNPHPSVVWAQRKDKLYVTIQLDSCVNPDVNLKENSLFFKGAGGPQKIVHEVTLEFFSDIIPEESKSTVSGREVIFMLKKKDQEAPFWPRLLKEKTKVHFLKTDFNRWKDEDDSDQDEQDDMNLEKMMSSMGGLGGMGGMGGMGDMAGLGGDLPDDEDDDSDEADLPDLK